MINELKLMFEDTVTIEKIKKKLPICFTLQKLNFQKEEKLEWKSEQ